MHRVSTPMLLAWFAFLAGAQEPSAIRFREVANAWGLDFRHHHGGSGQYFMVETMGGGVILFDYDGDGDADAFFVDSGALPGYQGEPARSRLLRNDGGGRFVDVTGDSGLALKSYGMGGSAGDVDGDADLDLYVTAFGKNQLFVNQGDGRFTDAGAGSGADLDSWSASAALADVDHDADLDLFVTTYVDFRLDNHKFCGDRERGIQSYCSPEVYQGLPERFFRNRGDGTFEDATAAAGLGGALGNGLGVVAADLTEDGWPDVYVANDASPNFLFKNRGDGSFEDISLASGTAFGDRGRPEGGMGVAVADYDADLLPDIVVTNSELETNSLFKNLGGELFRDSRYVARIAEPSLMEVAFGVAFADLDNDGDPDLAIANGHILDNAELFAARNTYKQRNQVFENLGGGKFRELLDTGVDVVRASRGLAVGDLDADGTLDLVIVNCNDVAEAYQNATAGGHWLAVELAGTASNRSGLGATIEVRAGASRQVQEVQSASSYLSQNEAALHFGLGPATAINELIVRWPSGRRQRFLGLAADRRLRIAEGEPTPAPAARAQ